jgi:hypothetical protein
MQPPRGSRIDAAPFFTEHMAMDEKKPTSSWDDLIKQVGAEPAADALERKRPAIETTFEPPPEIDASAIKAKPSDWNALADTLGIEAREPEPPRKSSRDASHETPGPSSNSLEASLAEIEPMESAFEEIIEEEISDIEFEEVYDDEGDEFGDPSGESVGDPNTLSGEAARNAFEALFDAGSFGALPPLKKLPAREPDRPRGGPQWRDPDAPRREEPRPPSERYELDEFEREGSEGEQARGDEEGDRPRRRRRRRGRGGSREDRGGRREAPRADDATDVWSESPQAEAADDEEREHGGGEGEGDERPDRRRRRRRRRGRSGEAGETPADRAAANGRSSRGAEEDEDEEEASASPAAGRDDEEDDDEGDLPRDSHKNIPTWAEAISVMVETNMVARKNSPSRPSSPRGRGRGRGRGGSGGRRGKS